ncbi:MAG TPA: NAD(P)/FAD-dependent oxidoreductase [Candidatus Lokiarchaeia archaeon]|nr:NAD(P)/FAD-dependent oxidoreductase [Candidatus Lokiarchaeia archaeon]
MNGTNSPDFDIIIVGAGPAGAMLAWQLMKKKASHPDSFFVNFLLVEKKTGTEYSNYHKKCGEGVSKAALDLIKPHGRVVRELTSAIEHWGSTPAHEFHASTVYIIDRPATLQSMLDDFTNMGGSMIVDDFSSAISDANGIVIVNLASGKSLACWLLVGADGPVSRVRRSCGFNNARIETLVQYLVTSESEKSATEAWYDQRYHGWYKYIFPASPGTVKLGFPHGTDVFAGATIEKQSRQIAYAGLDEYYKDGVVLLGDAAAQCNPITGGGMRSAFMAGASLAKTIFRHLNKKSKDSFAIQNAARKFSDRWKKSPYESRKYIVAHDMFSKMTNGEIEQFSVPIRSKSVVVAIASMLKRKKYWSIYRAFMNAEKYSW